MSSEMGSTDVPTGEGPERPLLDLYGDAEVFDFSRIPDRSKGIEPFTPEDMAVFRTDPMWRLYLQSEIGRGRYFLEDIDVITNFQADFWLSFEGNLSEVEHPDQCGLDTVDQFKQEVKPDEPCIDPSLIFSSAKRMQRGN